MTQQTNTLHDDAENILNNINCTEMIQLPDGDWQDCEAIDLICISLQSAFNAGAEAMREKAIEECEAWARHVNDTFKSQSLASEGRARSIRNLPLPPYGEKK